MEDMNNVMCKELSRGSKQKLLIISAFIHEPKIVFMDEPLINIDPSMQKLARNYFKSFIKNGNTIFLCTHILELAEKLCSRVGIINKGKVIYMGKIRKLKKKRKHLEEFYLKLVSE
jgi:ABC-2 type transport system ATP-binding protein